MLGVLALAVLLLGIWPAPLLNMMEASVQHLLQQILTSKIPGAAMMTGCARERSAGAGDPGDLARQPRPA